MKCLTSGTGLISLGIQDSFCALCGTALWHWLGMLKQLPPVPPMPPLCRGSSSPGTRKIAQTAFTYRQLFGLWEEGILNGDVFLKHQWPLLERACQIFGMSDLIQHKIYILFQKDLPSADRRCCTARWHLAQEPQDSDRCCWLSHASHCCSGLCLISFIVRFLQEIVPSRNSPNRMNVRKHVISNYFCHLK